jgi:hypothetical protein
METPLAPLLRRRLEASRKQTQDLHSRYQNGAKVTVAGVGRPLATAYEQLRNAAEYTDEHLLLQRAVRRYYVRNLGLDSARSPALGEELITELTESGYFANGSFSESVIAQINAGIDIYHRLYHGLRAGEAKTSRAREWVLDLLSAETERVLLTGVGRSVADQIAFAGVAYEYFLSLPPPPAMEALAADRDVYETSLYIAVHRALLKANILAVRLSLFRDRGGVAPGLAGFVSLNQEVDRLYATTATERLTRWVSTRGAPWRVLYGLMLEQNLPELLNDRNTFLSAYRAQIGLEYERLSHRLNRGLARSVVFLALSKVILGVAIEIPYDLYTTGVVDWLPLIVNLVFPPLYMASFKLSIRLPGRTNARALEDRIDTILFRPTAAVQLPPRRASRARSAVFNTIFTLFALGLFAGLGWALARLGFNVVQALIFFVFLSTASFLGFRLSRIVREYIVGRERPGFAGFVRDALSLPFIYIGQWLSSNYARINVAAFFLDLMIELPLKSVLRLIRQWMSFLSEKKDEI